MITIVDYDAGNMQSVINALHYIGCDTCISQSKEEILKADAVVLPGVGAFGHAMKNIRKKGLDEAIKTFIASGKPFLGICLGMQVLFDSSEESPGAKGLGLLKGKIRRMPAGKGLKIPHIGWNSLSLTHRKGLFQHMPEDPYVYFVHSYYLQADEPIVTATAGYGVTIDAAVQKGNLFAAQFHPEKSGDIGIQMLRNFKVICEGE